MRIILPNRLNRLCCKYPPANMPRNKRAPDHCSNWLLTTAAGWLSFFPSRRCSTGTPQQARHKARLIPSSCQPRRRHYMIHLTEATWMLLSNKGVLSRKTFSTPSTWNATLKYVLSSDQACAPSCVHGDNRRTSDHHRTDTGSAPADKRLVKPEEVCWDSWLIV